MKKEDAIKKVQQMSLPKETMEILEALIPELKESEDERIRKAIVELLKEIEEDETYTGRQHIPDMLAYLEKLKEQEEIPLMNGDADLYFDNWIQHNDTTKRGYFEEGMRYAQRLQKEQKPVEKISVSEELYEHIRNACACIDDAMSSDTLCDMTDYLEMADSSAKKAFDMVESSVVKQPADCIEDSLSSELDEMAEKAALQAYPVKKEDDPMGANYPPIDVNENERWAYEEGFKAGRESGLRDGQKYVLNNLDSYGLCKHAEWTECEFPQDIEKDAVQFCFDIGLNVTPYQAKQIASHYLIIGHNEGYIEGRKNAHIPAKELGLPSSMDYKQEWSEEDERIKSCICLALTDVNEQRFKDFGTTLKDCLAWVKDLHPSWKPSEEQN